MFSGGQLKAPEADCSEHSWPWKCRRKAGLSPSCMDQWSILHRTTPLLCPVWACPGMAERDAIQLKAVREWVPDEKWSMGLLGKGTGNSSYSQTRGGIRWVAGNNWVREKNISLYGRKTRRKIKEKARIGMSLVLGQSHSGELWSRSQDQVGHKSSRSPVSDSGNKYANKTSLPQWQQRWKQGIRQWILYHFC